MRLEGDPASLVGKDLSGHDLRNKDLTRKILFGTNLSNAKLKGATISLDCATFNGVTLDDRNVAMFLMMLQQAHIDERWQVGIRDLVKVVNGAEAFSALDRYLKLA